MKTSNPVTTKRRRLQLRKANIENYLAYKLYMEKPHVLQG